MLTGRAARCVALSLAVGLVQVPVAAAAPASVPASVAPSTAAAPSTRDPRAVAAYAAAVELMQSREYAEAVVELDLATALEPTWSDPVRVRADAFAALARRWRPNEFFLSARAADIRRLLALEPGVEESARNREIDTLVQQSEHARTREERRRKSATPALVLAISAGVLLVAGAMLHGMKPREFIAPVAYRQNRRDAAGIGMLGAGGVLAIPAIVVGAFAARQARSDAVVRDLQLGSGRPRTTFLLAPQLVRGGGGMGLAVRF